MMHRDKVISFLDGNAGYKVVQGQRSEMNDDEIIKAQKRSSPFPEVNYLSEDVTLERIENIEGENAYRIKVSDELTKFYSVETGLKVKEERMTEMGSTSIFYTDYQDISGVKFPFKISQTMGPRKFDFIVKSIKVNEGVTDEDFD